MVKRSLPGPKIFRLLFITRSLVSWMICGEPKTTLSKFIMSSVSAEAATAPRRLQSFGAGVQAVKLPLSEVLSTVRVAATALFANKPPQIVKPKQKT